MVETINIASFEFDTKSLEKSLEDLQKQLFEIQKEQKRYAKSNSDIQKQYNELDKQQVELKKRKQEESQAYKDVVAQMRALEQQQLGVFQSQKDLAIQASLVRKEYGDTVNVYKTLIGTSGELLTKEEALTNALQREVLTRAEAKKSNIELNKLKDQLNPKIKEEADLLDKLNEKVNQNNQFLKETGSEREKQISNIGNYKGAIIEAANELNIFNGGLGGFITRSQEAGGVGNLLKNSFGAITQGIVGMTRASLSFLATPIGAVIGALGLVLAPLISYLTSTQEGIDKVTAITRPLQSVFQSLIGVVQNVGKFLFDAFSNPKQVLLDLVDFVKNNVINRFKAFGVILDGIINLDFKKVADGVLQATTGVENVTDKIANAAKETDKFFTDAIKKGQELDRLEKELEKTRIKNKIAIGELTEQIKEQNRITEDQTKSLPEREKAAQNSIEASRRLNELKQKELDLEIEILKNKQSRNDTSRAEEEQLAELIAKKNESNAQQLELETTQQNKLNGIRKQATANAIEADKQRKDNAIKLLQEELDFFIESQGFKSKTLSEQLKIDEEIAKKSIEILNKELEAKKISRKKYDTEVLKIQQNLLKSQAELTIQNAQLELESYLKIQEEKLKTNQRISAEIVNNQKLALIDSQLAEEQFQAEKFAQGLINETEYQANLLAIREEYQVKGNEVEKKYQQQAKEDRDLLRALEFEEELLRLDSENALKFEKAQLQAGFEFQEAQLKLEEQRANGLISQANFDKALENLANEHKNAINAIEQEKFNFKLQAMSTTFGNVAEILGKETTVGKAAAIAQTTIDTYQSAVSAFKSLSGIPIVGPVLGGIASAAAVVSGIASVKKIASTKTPKASNPNLQGLATGGIVSGGVEISRANGDNRLITAKAGEVVLTEEQQGFIGSDVFKLAGVPGFATGGVVPSSLSSIQSQVTSVTDNLTLTEVISDAVMKGAMSGTSQGAKSGISDLSDNREIQRNATF